MKLSRAWLLIAAFAAGCGTVSEGEEQDDAEQAINEAACGTTAVAQRSEILQERGNTNAPFNYTPYSTGACADAAIADFKNTSPFTICGQLIVTDLGGRVSTAACSQLLLRVKAFGNGQIFDTFTRGAIVNTAGCFLASCPCKNSFTRPELKVLPGAKIRIVAEARSSGTSTGVQRPLTMMFVAHTCPPR